METGICTDHDGLKSESPGAEKQQSRLQKIKRLQNK
jgi:hypothetical protein